MTRTTIREVASRTIPTGLALLAGFLLVAAARPALAGVCTDSAKLAQKACRHDIKDDFFEARAICVNLEDEEEQAECRDEAQEERVEGRGECRDVFEARRELCEALGDGPYDPDFDPADFVGSFSDDMAIPNPYFPLVVGNTWEYEGDGETIVVEVLDKTKLIEGVTCIVVNDVVSTDGGLLIEDTDDWYAQALDGAVHYCGEIARDYEYFAGDDPMEAELVEIDGSFKEGRDGARSGILMMAMPLEGETYRQEFALGDAEDAGEVLATDYGYGNDPDLDQLVPRALAELLCDDDCVVTRDFTPLEPDVEERKYYAPGIGPFLEVNLEDEEIVFLVGCNVDPVCDLLP